MSNLDHDGLPPELSELGRRMRDERPVADGDALDRMMARARMSSRLTPRRAPRRAFAVSLATMLAMVSVTGVAAAALFGMSFSSLGSALFTNSTRQIGTASSQAFQAPAASNFRAPAASSVSRLPATIGSPAGSLGNLAGVRPPHGEATPALAAGPTASLLPGTVNASFHQYGARRLVCRILRALGLRFVARLLGC